MIEGGIRNPNVPDPASDPIAVSSGTLIRPTVAVVAAEDPETAANSAQPNTLTCSNPPGRRRVRGASPANMSAARRDRNRISPIQMKIGRAVRSQTVIAPQTLVANTAPAGAPEASVIAANPTAISANPTQRPSARHKNNTATRIGARAAISINGPPRRRRLRGRPRRARRRGHGREAPPKAHPPAPRTAGSAPASSPPAARPAEPAPCRKTPN